MLKLETMSPGFYILLLLTICTWNVDIDSTCVASVTISGSFPKYAGFDEIPTAMSDGCSYLVGWTKLLF